MSKSRDKPIAISGVLKRLGDDLNANPEFGIIDRYLHRSLLWWPLATPNSKDKQEEQEVPSWSWMACKGEIDYEDIPFYKVDWSDSVQFPSREGTEQASSDPVRNTELIARARDFVPGSLGQHTLKFDRGETLDTENHKCVILARMRESLSSEEQEHIVLVVEPVYGKDHIYRRIGIGSVQRRGISFDYAEEVWIV